MTCKLAQEILIGRHDDDLSDIVQAVGDRAVQVGSQVRWQIKYDDLTIDESTVTLDELERVEEITGKTWWRLDPRMPSNGSGVTRAWIQAVLESRKGMTAEDARADIGSKTMEEMGDILGEEVVTPGPFDSGSETTS